MALDIAALFKRLLERETENRRINGRTDTTAPAVRALLGLDKPQPKKTKGDTKQ